MTIVVVLCVAFAICFAVGLVLSLRSACRLSAVGEMSCRVCGGEIEDGDEWVWSSHHDGPIEWVCVPAWLKAADGRWQPQQLGRGYVDLWLSTGDSMRVLERVEEVRP